MSDTIDTSADTYLYTVKTISDIGQLPNINHNFFDNWEYYKAADSLVSLGSSWQQKLAELQYNYDSPVVVAVYQVIEPLKIKEVDNLYEKFPDGDIHGYLNHIDGTENYDVAVYPFVVKENLRFIGAMVISKMNKQGLKNVEFCFDEDYRLDYMRNNEKLKKIFNI